MEIYKVGGAVRDELLGREVTEVDYVVVGSTPEEMIALGYQPVGKHFPVFLHPETHEEYALARTERKSGSGHQGFVFHTEPSITLEDDLIRRDLTINALAMDDAGNVIDPYHGQEDLSKRILRHVSDAFSEDPLRVLRVARFKAQLAKFNFEIAAETLDLMSSLAKSGELETLSAERIWRETEKALKANSPALYFEVLAECGALNLFWDDLKLETLDRLKSDDPIARYAAIAYQAKAHFMVPKVYEEMARLLKKIHDAANTTLSAEDYWLLIKQLDAQRREERFDEGVEIASTCFPELEAFLSKLKAAAKALKTQDLSEIKKLDIPGQDKAMKLKAAQIELLQSVI